MKKQMKEKTTVSPLQDFNGRRLPIILHKFNTRKPSNISSSSSADEAPLNFPISSKTSSSSRTHLHKMSKSFSKTANSESTSVTPKVLSRSKENEIPTKPFSQKSKNNTKPICKSGQRSKLQSVQVNTLNKTKKKSAVIQSKMKKNSQSKCSIPGEMSSKLLSHLNFAESCTSSPVGRKSTSDFSTTIEDYFPLHERDEDNNTSTSTAVKTPPIEASLSPEIQSQTCSKIPVLKSANNTPICYGTGHLVSGVTDKRKCRRRGSLKGGFEKINLFDDKFSDDNMISDDSHDYSIPLLAEASVRWISSPCDDAGQCRSSGVDSVCSTLDNLARSRTRISWRDESPSRFVRNDDKENYLNGVVDELNCISVRGKEKTSLNRCNACAESICTDGGGLAASSDSDGLFCNGMELSCFRETSY